MKFRARSNDTVVRIASTTGHICLIGQEFTEVPEHIEAEAYANGCISEELYNAIKADLAKDALKGGGAPAGGPSAMNPPGDADKKVIIRTQIDAMLAGSEEGSFTAAGLPNLKVLSTKCGFQVSKEAMDPVWAEIVAEKQGA